MIGTNTKNTYGLDGRDRVEHEEPTGEHEVGQALEAI